MDQLDPQQLFQELIQQNEITILDTSGDKKQIEIISLSNTMILVRKNYQNIQNQFQHESQTLISLQQSLGNNFSQFFPHVFMICSQNKFVYMERMDLDFFDFVFRQRGLSEDIANGVNCLHQNNFIHGDIKLENLLIKQEGPLKLCDLGHSTQTQDGQVTGRRGTSRYVEKVLYSLFQTNQVVSYNGFKFDVFALGITLFETLTIQTFNQSILDKINNQNIFWQLMHKQYPSTLNWSQHLKQLFIKMVNPCENQRFSITDILNSQWILEEQQEQMQIEDFEEIGQQMQHLATDSSDVRGSEQDTQQAILLASKYLKEQFENEEFFQYLKLENERKAEKITLKALNKSCFITQLNPQDLLVILLREADQIANNWQQEGFLDDTQYIMNAHYQLKETIYSVKPEQDMQDEDEENELIAETQISNLRFRIKIWEIQDNESSFKSWLQFTNLNEQKDDYINFNNHIHNIYNIIKSY